MQKIFLLIMIFASTSALAGYKCTATKWSPSYVGIHYLSGIPKIMKFRNNTGRGNIEGLNLANIGINNGSVDYVFNGEIYCHAVGNCSLMGTVTEIFHGRRGNTNGFSNTFKVSITGQGQEIITLVENKRLKISCR